MTINNDIAARVEKGVAWLDEYLPGWESRIDLTQLDMLHACSCVLGQLMGRYAEGADYWSVVSIVTRIGRTNQGLLPDITQDEARAMGFEGPPETEPAHLDEWERLQDAWIAVVKERQGEASQR